MRVAVIGAGNMGKNHIRTWSQLASERSDIEFVGIADPMPQSKELAESYGVPWYASYHELIRAQKPQAVSVVVPTIYHKDVALDLIEQGIHLLIEKPIASTLKEATAIMDAQTKRPNVAIMVGHIEWFNPVVQKAYQMIKSGKIGTPYNFIAKRMKNKALEGSTNVILELGIHDVHLICSLLDKRGEDSYLWAFGQPIRFQRQEDFAKIDLQFEGAAASIFLSWASPKSERSLEIYGTRGHLKLDYIAQTLEVSLLDEIYSSETFQVTKKEPLREEIETFIATCQGKIKNPIPTEDATFALELCLGATNLARRKKWE